ncbi:MAG: aspartate aminotransferase family protein [Rhodospirillaceae bacterium]|nr:aspartate aminotransferase family protein [Rhodospirillaceae bacterium]
MDRGEGVFVFDTDGKKYLDACGGAAVSCLGHSDARVKQAIVDQLDRIPFAHTAFYTSEAAEDLADRLTAAAPGNLDRVYFVSGGSEATEAALKLARQYFVEKGELGRRNVITRRQSYHGNTLGALAAGGNQWRRAQFEPLLFETHHIAPCYEYRDRGDDETSVEYGFRVADELETKIQELGAETVMAFIAEPVVGATAGAVPPTDGYFKRVREICDRHGILLVLDEVMCGSGRTGTLFACEQDDIVPDILTMAKGLGAGYQPIGAVLVGAHIYDANRSGSGFFQHGHTYMAHPAACAASLAVLDVIEERGLLANVVERGNELREALNDRLGQHPYGGDVRGRGLFVGLEIVADRETKTPFEAAKGIPARIKTDAMSRGLMVYPMGGTIDGSRGAHVLLAPPYIIDSGHIPVIVDRLAGAIDAATAD